MAVESNCSGSSNVVTVQEAGFLHRRLVNFREKTTRTHTHRTRQAFGEPVVSRIHDEGRSFACSFKELGLCIPPVSAVVLQPDSQSPGAVPGCSC